MSVINKMLRDLDARRNGGTLPQLQRQGGPDALQGTSSVGPGAQTSAASGWRRGLAAVLLMAGGGLGVWYLLEAEQAPAAPPSPAVAPPASVPVTPATSAPAATASDPAVSASAPLSVASAPADAASAAVAAASSAVSVPVPAVAASAPPPLASTLVTPPAKRPGAGAAAPVTREPASAAVAAKAPTRRAVEAAARAVPPAPSAAKSAPAPVPSSAATPTPAQRRQAAAQETLAQAQALWAAGSREAAVDLVREAALLAERSQPPDATLLAQLVREQTRMELILGRPGAVLELLIRLEPLLSSQADLWAVRGNAAQRLGRHPESVHAYLSALQLRPSESRWMLGAAVSLAAQGQLEAAGQQAERARALGPVSPEVLNYLRQAGVSLR